MTTYDGSSLIHTLSVADDSIVSGLTYSFKYGAVNVIGESLLSPDVRYAIASPPAKPVTPTRATILNSKTQITVLWS